MFIDLEAYMSDRMQKRTFKKKNLMDSLGKGLENLTNLAINKQVKSENNETVATDILYFSKITIDKIDQEGNPLVKYFSYKKLHDSCIQNLEWTMTNSEDRTKKDEAHQLLERFKALKVDDGKAKYDEMKLGELESDFQDYSQVEESLPVVGDPPTKPKEMTQPRKPTGIIVAFCIFLVMLFGLLPVALVSPEPITYFFLLAWLVDIPLTIIFLIVMIVKLGKQGVYKKYQYDVDQYEKNLAAYEQRKAEYEEKSKKLESSTFRVTEEDVLKVEPNLFKLYNEIFNFIGKFEEKHGIQFIFD
jgi:hypothetical protein